MKKIKVIHIAYSDYIGGASRAALRIHKSLLKNNEVFSDLYVTQIVEKANVHKIEKTILFTCLNII